MSTCHKIFQVSEETQPILYTPIFLGNECFIIASQNRRRLDDATILNFSRFTADGEIIPLELITNDPAIYDFIFKQFRTQAMHDHSAMLNSTTTSLPELRARLLESRSRNSSQSEANVFQSKENEPMETGSYGNKHPFHATIATSTTELTSQDIEMPACRRCGWCKQPLERKKHGVVESCSRGCNTENKLNADLTEIDDVCTSMKKLNVFEQRKIRKTFEDFF